MGRGPSFNPQPFPGTHAPPGASPEALHELEKMKQDAPKPPSTPIQVCATVPVSAMCS